MEDREQVLDSQFDEFVAYGDANELAAGIREVCAGDAAQRDFLLQRLEERRRMFYERQ